MPPDPREYEHVGTPDWYEGRALAQQGITLVAFEALDGNTQGYAPSSRRVAVSQVAARAVLLACGFEEA